MADTAQQQQQQQQQQLPPPQQQQLPPPPPQQQPPQQQQEDMFEELNPDNIPTEIESLCMNCELQGTTSILLTRIPFFKEIILMAFTCPHCGFKSNEVQSGGEIAEKGVRYNLHVKNIKDVSRSVVKADTATIIIPELEFEIPANTQKGSLNTIEGFLMQSADALMAHQEARREQDPEMAEKIEEFTAKLQAYARLEIPFTFILDDPAGNSFIENPYP